MPAPSAPASVVFPFAIVMFLSVTSNVAEVIVVKAPPIFTSLFIVTVPPAELPILIFVVEPVAPPVPILIVLVVAFATAPVEIFVVLAAVDEYPRVNVVALANAENVAPEFIDVVNVGDVPKTRTPDPVSSLITPASSALVVAAKSPNLFCTNANVPVDPDTVMPLILERPAIVVEDEPSEIAVVPTVTEEYCKFALVIPADPLKLLFVNPEISAAAMVPQEGTDDVCTRNFFDAVVFGARVVVVFGAL